LRAGVVERCLADEAASGKRLLAAQVGGGKITRGLRLAHLLGDGFDFGGPPARSQIFGPRLCGLELRLGLAPRGRFIDVLQGKDGRAGRHLVAALHADLLQGARERRRQPYVFALDVALQRAFRRLAAGHKRAR